MGQYIVMSGLPASGKTTVGRAIAQFLCLPMLDKDDFLEALFEDVTVGGAQGRRELSRQADDELRRHAEKSDGAVLASWWRHPHSSLDSGTRIDWLASLPGVLVEVHCACSPAVATGRFFARTRHPGHFDGRWSHAELLGVLSEQSELGPLGIGKVVRVSTGAGLHFETVMRDISRAIEMPPPEL